MPSSQTNPTELPRFGWPIERKLEPRQPKSLTKAGVSLHAAGDPPLIVRGCRESSQSTRAFCLWITFEDQLSKYAPKGWGPPPDSPTPPPFSIQPISGCGRGMVANKTIKTGEIIVVERPIVVHPATTTMILHHPNGMWGHLEDIYEQHFQLLGEKEQSLYMDLWNCKPVTGTLGNQLVGIARTNGLYSGFTRTKHTPHYAGVYPKISRCNHSCGPNADAKFDEEKMAMTLIAQRTIPAGDQVTIGYTNLEAPYSARQDDLNTKYIFTCACKHCKPSKPSRPSRPLKHPYWCFPNQTTGEHVDLKAEIDASDVRRDQISHRLAGARELWADWLSPSSRQSDRDLLQFHEDALVIIAQEGLEWTRILDIAYLAHACAALEDEGGFRRWGTMLMSISGTQGDEGKSQMKTWQDWVREPKTSPAWGLRVQARGRTEGTPSRKGKAWHISFT
ncbi:SET domain-containing protein [Rickenella mellea]|uniref:SET domain-containing protein n=1 Tax=Rickenella mellea TaxID=50990 RepID=A0A4Y7QAP3_9AGAM|nr:SET domain-containing protein [Rickenella mellea]